MKIHCICVARDEIDMLPYTLDAALRWADAIYALDNGSTDGTWELLQEYARRDSRVVLAGRTHETYRNSMVSDVANQFLGRASRGDWWCRLDADELYAEDPRRFLGGVSRRDQVVYAIVVNYYFTDADLEQYERDPKAYVERWSPDRLRHYTTNYSEPRFVRHVPGLPWVDRWPRGFWYMRPASSRILMRNYDYRTPPQIERRIHLRTRFTEAASFPHEKKRRWAPVGFDQSHVIAPSSGNAELDSWRTRVVRSSALYRDDGGPLRINWTLVPPIWMPMPGYLRVAKRIRHWWRRLTPAFGEAGS